MSIHLFIYLSNLAFRILLACILKNILFIKNTIHDEMFLLQCFKIGAVSD